MAREPEQTDQVQVPFRRVLADPLGAIKTAQTFAFTRVGDDFQVDVGYFDMPNFREGLEKAKAGEEAEVLFVVTDRFALSKSAFERLLHNVRDIEAKSMDIGLEAESASS